MTAAPDRTSPTPAAPAAPAGPAPAGRDRGTYGGMLAVAVAAAVLSFSALAGLAVLAGVSAELPLPRGSFRLAWLLPIAVDAYAVTATRVWLRTAGTPRTRLYARRNAIGAIGLSVAGNAAFHALVAAGVVSLAAVPFGWAVVVAVSAVPPVMLGLVGHLHALVSEDHRHPATADRAGSVAPAGGRDASGAAGSDASGVDATTGRTGRGAGGSGTGSLTAGRTGATRAGGTGSGAGSRTGSRRPARTGTRTAGRTGPRTDAELTAVLAELPREPDGTVPIRRATAALGCGPDRARRLLAAAALLRTPADPTPGDPTPAEAGPTPETPETVEPAAAPDRLAA